MGYIYSWKNVEKFCPMENDTTAKLHFFSIRIPDEDRLSILSLLVLRVDSLRTHAQTCMIHVGLARASSLTLCSQSKTDEDHIVHETFVENQHAARVGKRSKRKTTLEHTVPMEIEL